MFDENHEESKEGHGYGMHGKMMWMHMPKEFKLALLEKKEKMIQAKLEFIGKMKEMVKNMPDKK